MGGPARVDRSQVTAALLAGGRSRRMGVEKALLVLDGQRLVERAAGALSLFPRRMLVLDRPGDGPLRDGRILPNWPRVYDRFPDAGPLGALVTALAASSTPWVVLAACDMPFLTAAYYEALLARLDPACRVLVPRWEGGAEPLAGAYHRDALPWLVEAVSRGELAVMEAVAGLPHCPVEPGWLEPLAPRRLFRNVNRPEEYEALWQEGPTPAQRAFASAEAVSLEEASRRLLDGISPLPEEMVPLTEARGRRLARAVRAPGPVPQEARSALDGYALRCADLPRLEAGGVVWIPLAGARRAGPGDPAPLPPGTACRVATGAMLPTGADAVVRWEETEVRADAGGTYLVGLRRLPESGEGVVPAGEEARAGDLLLDEGSVIDGASLGRLATAGLVQVPVRRPPRVWLLTVGDELLPPGAPYRPGGTYESNGLMLGAWLRDLGAEVTLRGPVPDDREALVAALLEAARARPDLIVTCGGISAGPYDLVAPALEAMGARILFRRLAIHPGKACAAADLAGLRVVALSGSPGAAALDFWLVVRPAVERLLGRAWEPLRVRLPLAGGYPRASRQRRFLWASLERGPDGGLWARPGPIQHASAVASLQAANCLIEVTEGSGPLAAGDPATVWLLSMKA